jgi:selenium-binding protein 1
VAELLYDFGDKAKNSMAIYSDISDDGKLAYFTFTLGNHVAALDISDLNNVKRLDDPNADQPIIGPHYVKISPDKKNLLVTGYFVQAGDVRPPQIIFIDFIHANIFVRSLSSTLLATIRVTGLTSCRTVRLASTELSTSRRSSAALGVVLGRTRPSSLI